LSFGTDYVVAWARSFILPHYLGGKVTTFTATGSIANTLHERDPSRRAGLLARLRHVLFDCGAWFHALLILTFTVSAAVAVRTALTGSSLGRHGHDWSGLWIQLLQLVAWPSHPWIPTVLACLTPIRYAVIPPDLIGGSGGLLKKDDGRGRHAAVGPGARSWSIRDTDYVVIYTLFMVYIGVIFIGSWWL
jgi:hypothetical protein